MAKYRIRHSCTPDCHHGWERPVRNYTGKPWLIDYPHPYTFNYGPGWVCTSAGTGFDTFEEARAYLSWRLSDLHPVRAGVL